MKKYNICGQAQRNLVGKKPEKSEKTAFGGIPASRPRLVMTVACKDTAAVP